MKNDIELDFNIIRIYLLNGEKESIKNFSIFLWIMTIKEYSIKGKISVKLTVDKSKIEVDVKNTGEGISKETILIKYLNDFTEL